MNWRGTPLVSLAAIVSLIASTDSRGSASDRNSIGAAILTGLGLAPAVVGSASHRAVSERIRGRSG